MEYTYPHTDRRTGRTTFMIKELVNSVLDGQPYSIVVGANHYQCKDLYHATLYWLYVYNVPSEDIEWTFPRRITLYDSEILFFTKAEFEGDRVRGMNLSKYGIFEDHLAAGEW